MENEVQSGTPFIQRDPEAPVLLSAPMNWSRKIFLTLFGLVVIAGSIFAGIQIEKLKIPLKSTLSLPTPTEQAHPSPLVTPDTNNWRSYSGKDFSFQYPNSWPDAVATQLSSTRNEIVIEGNLVIDNGTFYDKERNVPMTYKEYIQQSVPPKVSKTPFTIGSLKGVRYSDEDNAGRTIINIILSDAEDSYNIFSLIYMSNTDVDTANSVINPVISTFKFTGTQSTADWRIFHDDRLGVEFKYPGNSTPIEAYPSGCLSGIQTANCAPERYEIHVVKPCSGNEHGGCSDYIGVTVFMDPNSESSLSYHRPLPKTRYIDSSLGGLPAKKLVNSDGSEMAGGPGVTAQQFYTVNKYGYFIVTGSLRDPIIKSIIDSFKFF